MSITKQYPLVTENLRDLKMGYFIALCPIIWNASSSIRTVYQFEKNWGEWSQKIEIIAENEFWGLFANDLAS